MSVGVFMITTGIHDHHEERNGIAVTREKLRHKNSPGKSMPGPADPGGSISSYFDGIQSAMERRGTARVSAELGRDPLRQQAA
jgi:hypothetical protein